MFSARKKVPVICFRNIILNNSLGCTNSVNLAFARFKQEANLSLLENLIEVFSFSFKDSKNFHLLNQNCLDGYFSY